MKHLNILIVILLFVLCIALSGCSSKCYMTKTDAVKDFCRANSNYGITTTDCVERLLNNPNYEFNKCEK